MINGLAATLVELYCIVGCTNFQVIGYLLDFCNQKSSKYMYTLYMYLLNFHDGDGDDEEQN